MTELVTRQGQLLDAAGEVSDAHFTIAEGRIGRLEAAPAPRDRLIMPALANAHDHARPLSPTSFGASNQPLESWLPRLSAMAPVDPYLASAAPLARAALAGLVSIMVHYVKPQGTKPLIEEAADLRRAARDVGVKLAFAIGMRDQNPLVYGDASAMLEAMPKPARSEIESLFAPRFAAPKAQIEQVRSIAAALETPNFKVQLGPSGLQWCSRTLLEAIAAASAEDDRRVHMHFLETKYQRAWADRHLKQGAARFLKEIGLLSPRLALAHCVYASDEDLDLIAEAGAIIVTNASSNLHLRSGIAPIGRALARGCRIAFGVDGCALDEDDDGLREMRLGHFLHAGTGYDSVISRQDWLFGGIAAGRLANGHAGSGALEPGAVADFMALDLAALDRDAILPVPPIDFLFARATKSAIREVFADGRKIVADGAVLGVDLPAIEAELRAQFRAGLKGRAGFLDAWPALAPRLADFYRLHLGCC